MKIHLKESVFLLIILNSVSKIIKVQITEQTPDPSGAKSYPWV